MNSESLGPWAKLGAAGIVGILIGYGATRDGTAEQARAKQAREVAATVAALKEDVAALGASVTTVGSAVTALEGSVTALSGKSERDAAALDARLAGIEAAAGNAAAPLVARIDTLEGSVQAALADLGKTQEQAIAGAMSRVAEQLSGLSRAPAPATAAAVAEEAPAAEPAAADPAEAPAAAGELADSIGPGQAISLADGALKVFLSSVTEAGHDSSAVVAVNGLARMTLVLGKAASVKTDAGVCALTLDAVSGRRARITGTCGG